MFLLGVNSVAVGLLGGGLCSVGRTPGEGVNLVPLFVPMTVFGRVNPGISEGANPRIHWLSLLTTTH